jgi:hypothetical protein
VTSTGIKTEWYQISDVTLSSCADGSLFLPLMQPTQWDDKHTQIIEFYGNEITVASIVLV